MADDSVPDDVIEFLNDHGWPTYDDSAHGPSFIGAGVVPNAMPSQSTVTSNIMDSWFPSNRFSGNEHLSQPGVINDLQNQSSHSKYNLLADVSQGLTDGPPGGQQHHIQFGQCYISSVATVPQQQGAYEGSSMNQCVMITNSGSSQVQNSHNQQQPHINPSTQTLSSTVSCETSQGVQPHYYWTSQSIQPQQHGAFQGFQSHQGYQNPHNQQQPHSNSNVHCLPATVPVETFQGFHTQQSHQDYQNPHNEQAQLNINIQYNPITPPGQMLPQGFQQHELIQGNQDCSPSQVKTTTTISDILSPNTGQARTSKEPDFVNINHSLPGHYSQNSTEHDPFMHGASTIQANVENLDLLQLGSNSTSCSWQHSTLQPLVSDHSHTPQGLHDQSSAQRSKVNTPSSLVNSPVKTSDRPLQMSDQHGQMRCLSAHSSNHPVQMSDQHGQMSCLSAQSSNHSVQISDQHGQMRCLSAQSNIHPVQMSDQHGQVSCLSAQSSNHPVQMSDQHGQMRCLSAQSSNHPVQMSDQHGQVSCLSAQSSNHPVQMSDQHGQVSCLSAQSSIHPVQISDQHGQMRCLSAQSSNHPVQMSDQHGQMSCLSAQSSIHPVQMSDQNGQISFPSPQSSNQFLQKRGQYGEINYPPTQSINQNSQGRDQHGKMSFPSMQPNNQLLQMNNHQEQPNGHHGQLNSHHGRMDGPLGQREGLHVETYKQEQIYHEIPADRVVYPVVNQTNVSEVATSVATIKHIASSQVSDGGCVELAKQLLLCLQTFILKHIPQYHSLDNISNQDFFKSPELIQLIRELATLGTLAKYDLEKYEEMQRNNNTMFRISETGFNDSNNQMDTTESRAVESGQMLSQENRLDQFKRSVEICKQANSELDNEDQNVEFWSSNIQSLYNRFKDNSNLQKSAKIQNEGKEKDTKQALELYHSQEKKEKSLRTLLSQKIENSKWKPLLFQVSDCLCDVMEKYRLLEAWMCTKLTTVPTDLDGYYTEIDGMFTKYFDYVYRVVNQLAQLITSCSEVLSTLRITEEEVHVMKHRVSSVAWYFEKQLSTCILTTEKNDLAVRLPSLTLADVDDAKSLFYIYPQSDHDCRHLDKYLSKNSRLEFEDQKQHDNSAVNTGIKVSVKDLTIGKGFTRPYKRGSVFCFEQFYRISLVVKLQSHPGPDLECLSLPFTIRTGSDQLWECEGAVKWYCFCEVNLYTSPLQSNWIMPIDKILCMFQAIVSTHDPSKIFDADEVQALRLMLHTVTKSQNNPITLRQLVRDHMPYQGHHTYNDDLNYSCFTWFMAAVNSQFFLTDCKLSGRCTFLNFEQCNVLLGRAQCGNALFRISMNEVDGPQSKMPYASIVVCFYSAPGVFDYKRVKVKELKPDCFLDHLSGIKDTNGKTLIKTILPDNISLEDLQDSNTRSAIDEVTVNDYRTRYKQPPRDTIILEKAFEDMNILAEGHSSTQKKSQIGKDKKSKFARVDDSTKLN